ncbi:unnamed protein product [Linum trigynum]|uniref:Uncharacterized protein n=1 Tax=Linum trigynum TaxID=586398 RepID=A0AAV2CYA5_9ROSI
MVVWEVEDRSSFPSPSARFGPDRESPHDPTARSGVNIRAGAAAVGHIQPLSISASHPTALSPTTVKTTVTSGHLPSWTAPISGQPKNLRRERVQGREPSHRALNLENRR